MASCFIHQTKLCYEEATISAPGYVHIQGQAGASRSQTDLSSFTW